MNYQAIIDDLDKNAEKNCPICTYKNPAHFTNCDICQNPLNLITKHRLTSTCFKNLPDDLLDKIEKKIRKVYPKAVISKLIKIISKNELEEGNKLSAK